MMKQSLKKVVNKSTALIVAGSVMGIVAATMPAPAQARSSWSVSFSSGPVYVAPAPVVYCPPPVVRCRPVYYYSTPCPPPVVYYSYPAPYVSVSYYRHR